MLKDNLEYNKEVKPSSRDIEILKENFPHFFDKDGNFLFDKFKEMIEQKDIALNKEGYELKFLGKSYARYLSSMKTETFVSPHNAHNEKEENKNSENLYLIGDNLDALKHLLGSYAGKIKCIYIDPPYNTGSDGFVYPDNFQFDATQLAEVIGIEEEEAERILNLKGKSSHSAWLTFMYPRLILARELLSDDGVIFISIDDNEQSNLKLMCDEIFGEENLISEIVWKRKRGRDNSARWFSKSHEYCLVYTKKKELFSTNYLKLDESTLKAYKNPDNDPRGVYRILGCWARGTQGGVKYKFITKDGKVFTERLWLFSKENLEKLDQEDKLIIKGDNVYRKMFLDENKGQIPETLWDNVSNAANASDEIKELFKKIIFETPKPIPYIRRMLEISISKDDIVLDFFSGSATTAHAVMQLNAEDGGNRKYILVQIPEEIGQDKPAYKAGYKTIDQIGRERIQKAAEKIKQETNANIDYGFKTYSIHNATEELIDQLHYFDENISFNLNNPVSPFDTEYAQGQDVILSTYLVLDGYGLSKQAESYQLNTYQAKLIENSLYIIEQGLTSSDVMELVRRIETLELDINRVVVYQPSILFNIHHELKQNLNNLKNNKKVELIERF